MLSVLMLCPQFHPIVGGYERAAARLSAALAESGHRVVVIAERRRRDWPATERIDGYEVRRLPCVHRRHLHAITSLLSFAAFLLRHGREFDLWEAHQHGPHSALAVALGKLMRRPVVVKSTSTGAQGIARSAGKLLGFVHRGADACIAPSVETREEAIRYGIPADRVHLVPNGVDGREFHPASAAERDMARRALGLECQRLVLYVGRLSGVKNPLGLLDAWAAIDATKRRGTVLAIVGDGPQREEVRARARDPEIAESVHLAGQRSDVATWYRAADLFVLPSRLEGLSNAMIEALASGLAVVSTRVAGSSILLESPAAGVVVDVGDPAAMARALEALLEEAALRSRLGAAARARFESRYSLDSVSRQTRSLYDHLLGPRPLRVLMAVAKFPFPVRGGQERQAHELAKALVQRGNEVHVLSSRFDAAQARAETIDGAHVHRVRWIESRPLRFVAWPFSIGRSMFRLGRGAAVVHVHSVSWFGAFVTLAAKSLGIPVITKLPNFGEFGIPGMRRPPFGGLRIALLKWSDAIIAMNQESVAELASIGYPASQVLKIPNGIPPLPAAIREPAAAPREVSAVFVGTLTAQKGLHDLVHAWAAVRSRARRPVKLRLIGDGPQADDLRTLAATLRLDGSVEFRGYRADVTAELRDADLFVLPSYGEGNSNAILEAMRAGLPIVATRLGGAPAQVGGEGERFLVPPGDREALATRMIELIEDESLRLRVGTAMRARSAAEFSIDRVAAVYEEAYELMLSGKRERIGELGYHRTAVTCASAGTPRATAAGRALPPC